MMIERYVDDDDDDDGVVCDKADYLRASLRI